MSNYSSVVIVWNTHGEEPDLEDDVYQAKYAKGLADVAAELGGSVNGIIWGCGAGGDTMVCENVAQLCVNHLIHQEILPAICKAAAFLLNPGQDTEVFFKTEDDDCYSVALI